MSKWLIFSGFIVLSAGCFASHSFLAGVVILSLGLGFVLARSSAEERRHLSEVISNLELKRKCNCFIVLKINIENVLNSPLLSDWFHKNQEEDRIDKALAFSDWTGKLASNYKEKNKKEDTVEGLVFNVQNNLLWVNNEIAGLRAIYHEIEIPFLSNSEQKEEEKTNRIQFASIEEFNASQALKKMDAKERKFVHRFLTKGGAVAIRAIVVNGILKIQVGRFQKGLSPTICDDSSYATYQQYLTITSFPLICYPFEHQLPEEYLNFQYRETEDGAELGLENREYNYLWSIADHCVDKSKWEKIAKKFHEKADAWLKREDFTNQLANDSNDYFLQRLNRHQLNYSNKYLNIFISNNMARQEDERELWRDYYEETP